MTVAAASSSGVAYPELQLSPAQPTPAREMSKMAVLEDEIKALQVQLGALDPQSVVDRHISLLHTYNEVKDAAQTLIGKYAVIKHTTIRAVHEELDLSLIE